MCLDASAEGRHHPLHATRPDATTNRSGAAVLASLRGARGDMYGPSHIVSAAPPAPSHDVLVVCIDGPIEERAGYHDPCSGWTDGHDAIYDRLAAAFEIGDVVLIGNSPGGAVSGGPEFMRRAQAMKAKHGRRCYGHTETLAASMCVWWMSAICDSIYVSADARFGSVGARGMHASIAGALVIEGVVPTFSAWPNDGKIAGVAELPLSDVGRARMDRDVALAGEAFAACLAASATSMRAGLTRDAIVNLGADCLTGQAAVDAGLADGIAPLEDVLSMALATAGTGATMEEKKEPGEGADDAPPKDDEDTGAQCSRCDKPMTSAERFCSKCGTDSVPAAEDEDAPPSSEPAPKKDEDARAHITPPAARTGASIAALLGLRADASHPAIVAEMTGILRAFDHAAQLTGERSPTAIIGGLSALAADAAAAAQVQRDLKAAQAVEMLGLAKRAAAVDASRDGWLVDKVGADGARTVALGPKARGYDRDGLKAYVEGREKSAGPKRTPFTASTTEASKATDAARAAGNVDASKSAPAVAHAVKAGVKADEAAAIHAREFGGAQ